MKSPECYSIRELNSILLRLGEMEGTVFALREKLRMLPRKIAKELKTESERIEAARFLYWRIPQISGTHIAKALLGMNAKGSAAPPFLALIGPLSSDFLCERCGKAIICKTRANLQELEKQSRGRGKYRHMYDGRYQLLCEDCKEIVWQEIRESRQNRIPL